MIGKIKGNCDAVGTLVYIGRNLEYTSEVGEPLECKHKDGETSVKCELKFFYVPHWVDHTL